MDLEGIRLLMRVVELGSVQRAAEQMGIPRSSLRRRLDNLEADIGAELLLRTSTGASLTQAGAVVVDEGRALLEHAERMVSTARATVGEPADTVRIIMPIGIPDEPHVMLVRMTVTALAGVHYDEHECVEPLDHLHEPFDLMFHFGDPPERGQWFSRVVRRVRLVPLASQAYLERHGRPSSASELAGHRILGWRLGRQDPTVWPLWRGGGVKVEPMFTSGNGHFLHRVAQEGLGILLGDPEPQLLVGPTRLVPLLADEVGYELTFRCLSPLPVDVEPRARAVLATIQGFLTRFTAGE